MKDQLQLPRQLTFRILTTDRVCILSDDRTIRPMVRATIGDKTIQQQKSKDFFSDIKIDIQHFFGFLHLLERLRWSRGSVLAFVTQVCWFAPGRSRRIFRAKISSARLPSEGK